MLVLSECNDRYSTAIAFTALTLHEIKQYPDFGGHPVHEFRTNYRLASGVSPIRTDLTSDLSW
jgi:hypothetical protein